jgi:hypothetical protein
MIKIRQKVMLSIQLTILKQFMHIQYAWNRIDEKKAGN